VGLVYRKRLLTAYGFLAVLGLILGGVYLAAGLIWGGYGLFVAGLVAMAATTVLLISRALMAHGRDLPAAYILASGLFVGGLVYSMARPGSIPSIALIPLVVVLLALPVLHGPQLRALAVTSWCFGVALIVANLVWVSPIIVLGWFSAGVRSIGYAVVLAVVLGMLLAHNQRMHTLMARTVEGERAVRDANERLMELDRAKTYFMNTVSHELRTPMTPVLLQLRLLSDGHFGGLNQKQHRSLSIVVRNVKRLNSITSELLDLARLQSGRLQLHLKEVDLGPLIEEVVETFRPVAKEKQIQLKASTIEGVQVDADPKRLIQVLYNLLDNALKFTPEGGTIQLEHSQAGRQVEVRVTDSGRGMRPEQTEALFKAFSRVHDAEGGTEPGTGLGLYICKTIVDVHGGRIWAESEGEGEGTTFAFTVPLAGDIGVTTELWSVDVRDRLRQAELAP
jgi:signal transduction histidine kinase